MERITLGSASPRRLELLKKFGYEIDVKPPEIQEIFNSEISVEENARKIAEEKLKDVKKRNPEDRIIITADTFIAVNGRCLGKPENRDHAFSVLKELSGITHRVLTGVSIYSKDQDRILTEVDITEVTFRNLSESVINGYLDLNQWQDAAGAYKIQDMGEILIEKINGSYSSVMGLPISRIYGMFVSLKFINPVI